MLSLQLVMLQLRQWCDKEIRCTIVHRMVPWSSTEYMLVVRSTCHGTFALHIASLAYDGVSVAHPCSLDEHFVKVIQH
jgi:hypothetical protein